MVFRQRVRRIALTLLLHATCSLDLRFSHLLQPQFLVQPQCVRLKLKCPNTSGIWIYDEFTEWKDDRTGALVHKKAMANCKEKRQMRVKLSNWLIVHGTITSIRGIRRFLHLPLVLIVMEVDSAGVMEVEVIFL